MSSLIPDSEKAALQQGYADFFDTFKRKITVHKAPNKVVEHIDVSFLYGYGEESSHQEITDSPPSNSIEGLPTDNYAYEPESSEFYALVWYPKEANQDLEVGEDIRAFIPDGEIRIKVDKIARDYLTIGKNVERIDVQDHSYILISEDAEVNHLFTGYYIFKLKEIS